MIGMIPSGFAAAEKSAKEAYRQAGVGPKDIDFFEIHDAFSIMSALSLEACGFAERGQGPRLALEGEIKPAQGEYPYRYNGWVEGPGSSSWCDRDVPDRGSCPAAAWGSWTGSDRWC